jgi:hypothetical protein
MSASKRLRGRLIERALISISVLSSLSGVSVAATPHNINAAEIGTGVPRGLNWSDEAAQSPIWCGSACSYLRVSTAKIAPDTLWTYTPTAWPGNSVTAIPNPSAVSRSTLTPVGTTDSQGREIVHNSAYYQRGAVVVTRAGDSLQTSVYQSGNQSSGAPGKAAAALAYHVRAQNQSSGSRDYFIRFTAPKPTGGVSVPYYIGGPSGQQPMNVNQNKYAKSRSVVDVLVNGLPVWSSSTSYVIPEKGGSSSNYTGYALDFGYESDDDYYTVFIGRFASTAYFDINFIVRAESLSRAPSCGTVSDSMTHPNPKSRKYCLLITENRELLPAPNQDALFEIYSKVVSTPIYELPPGIGLGTVSSELVYTQD